MTPPPPIFGNSNVRSAVHSPRSIPDRRESSVEEKGRACMQVAQLKQPQPKQRRGEDWQKGHAGGGLLVAAATGANTTTAAQVSCCDSAGSLVEGEIAQRLDRCLVEAHFH